MDEIRIKQLEVFAHHGVFPEENRLGQKFVISAALRTHLRTAGLTDDLTQSMDYGAVCAEIQTFLTQHTFQLLETAAEKLCEHLLQTLPLPEFYEELLIRTGYVAMLEEKNTPENRVRLENVRELKSSILTYMGHTEQPTLGGFLEEIALYTDIEQYDKDADAVVMMTMHSAKGLEFPNVYLVGAEEGLFPGLRAIGDAEELEEERRLCYVAITRAKRRLTISSAQRRMLYGHTTVNRPSRFLAEIPSELIEERSALPPVRPLYQNAPQRPAYRMPPIAPTARQSIPDYQKGDMVRHDVFGRGMILSVLKMGNDAMLEIAFDQVGTKRLMAGAACARMKKEV